MVGLFFVFCGVCVSWFCLVCFLGLLLLSLLCVFSFYGIVTAVNMYRFSSRFTFALAMTELCGLNSLPCSLRHATERVERPGESQLALDGKKKLHLTSVFIEILPI